MYRIVFGAALSVLAACQPEPAPVQPPPVQTTAAVVEPSGICTADLSVCGGPSACGCPTGYTYDRRTLNCIVNDLGTVSDRTGSTAPNACAVQPAGICTRDLNPAGFASICQCDPGFTYDQRVGLCLVDDLATLASP